MSYFFPYNLYISTFYIFPVYSSPRNSRDFLKIFSNSDSNSKSFSTEFNRGGINNQISNLYFFGLVLLSKFGIYSDIFFTCTCSSENPTSEPLKGLKYSESMQSLLNASAHKDYFHLPFITFHSDDHGVIIVRVDVDCIFFRENDHGFWRFCLAFSFDIREAFYIQNLANVPSMGRASFLAPTNFLAIVLSMWHTILFLSPWDISFAFLDLGLPPSSSPRELDVSDPREESPFTYFLKYPS